MFSLRPGTRCSPALIRYSTRESFSLIYFYCARQIGRDRSPPRRQAAPSGRYSLASQRVRRPGARLRRDYNSRHAPRRPGEPHPRTRRALHAGSCSSRCPPRAPRRAPRWWRPLLTGAGHHQQAEGRRPPPAPPPRQERHGDEQEGEEQQDGGGAAQRGKRRLHGAAAGGASRPTAAGAAQNSALGGREGPGTGRAAGGKAPVVKLHLKLHVKKHPWHSHPRLAVLHVTLSPFPFEVSKVCKLAVV